MAAYGKGLRSDNFNACDWSFDADKLILLGDSETREHLVHGEMGQIGHKTTGNL